MSFWRIMVLVLCAYFEELKYPKSIYIWLVVERQSSCKNLVVRREFTTTIDSWDSLIMDTTFLTAVPYVDVYRITSYVINTASFVPVTFPSPGLVVDVIAEQLASQGPFAVVKTVAVNMKMD